MENTNMENKLYAVEIRDFRYEGKAATFKMATHGEPPRDPLKPSQKYILLALEIHP